MFDLVIKGGKIYTGAGNPWFKGDVAVKDGRIAEIGKLSKEARNIIDASARASLIFTTTPTSLSSWSGRPSTR